MKKVFYKFLLKRALVFTRNRAIYGEPLTPEFLCEKGWRQQIHDDKLYFVEPNIKDREKIWIQFEHHYYRVFHGPYRNFIALESTKEWLHIFLSGIDKYDELKTRRLL